MSTTVKTVANTLFNYGTYYLMFAILGTVFASFAEVLSERIPAGESWVKGRSHCPSCGHTLTARDLFPVFSYLFLKGKCRYCGAPIGKKSLLTELGMAAVFVLIGWQCGLTVEAIKWMAFAVFGYVVAAIDYKTGLISDAVVITGGIIGLVLSACSAAFTYMTRIQSINNFIISMTGKTDQIQAITAKSVFSAAWGMGASPFFWNGFFRSSGIVSALIGATIWSSMTVIIIMASGSKMGWGDFTFSIALGAFMGSPNTIVGMMLSFFLGGIISALLLAFKIKKRTDPIPFGPFMAISTMITGLFGQKIIAWYTSLSQIKK